jgi:hypothetical protein
LHCIRQEKNGLSKKNEIISENVAVSLQQDMAMSDIEFEHAKKIFKVPLLLSNTAISSLQTLDNTVDG